MTNLAVNDKGEAVFFDGKDWKPAQIAANDKGERMAFNGAEWKALPKSDGGPSKVAKIAGDVAEGVNTGVNWAGTQFTKGITGMLGASRALSDTVQGATEWAGEKLGASPETVKRLSKATHLTNPVMFGSLMPSPEDMNNAIFGGKPNTLSGEITGSANSGRPSTGLGVPEVNAADARALTLTKPFGLDMNVNLGKMADAGMQAIPGMLAMPTQATKLPAFAQAATTAVPAFAGGALSEAAGQGAEGTPYEIPARVLGGAAGFIAGNKAVSPLPARLTPEQARSVALAKDADIPLTVGQETGRGRGIESALARFPTSSGQFAAAADEQGVAINKMALKQMDAPKGIERVHPQSMKAVVAKASNDFETAKNTSGPVTLKPDFFNAAGAKVADYLDNTAQSAVVPSVRKRLDDFFDAKLVKSGNPYPELSGEQYQEFRRGLNTAIQNTSDSGAKKALQGMRGALDDAMEASLPADKAEAWRDARKNWGNLKIIEKAAAYGTTEGRAAGNLTAGGLTSAVRQAQGAGRFATTEGGLNDVARVAGYLADTTPNSGTPQTLAMQRILSGGVLSGGAGAGFMAGGLPGAAVGAGAMIAPNLVARAMTGGFGGGWARNYLANQSAPAAYPQLYGNGWRDAPFSLAPGGVIAAPRLEKRQ